jgi:hypothetical protein
MKRVLVANAKGPWFPIWDPGSYCAMLEIGSLRVPAPLKVSLLMAQSQCIHFS